MDTNDALSLHVKYEHGNKRVHQEKVQNLVCEKHVEFF